LLLQLRGKIIFSTLQNRKEKIQADIANIEYEIQTNSTSVIINIDKLDKFHLGLDNLRNKKNEGTIIRSITMAQWYEQGEQSVTYLCNLEKKTFM
jgi:hypothetical protein